MKNIIAVILFLCCCCQTAFATGNCSAKFSASFSSDGKSVTVSSSKDLSHVILTFCDGTSYKFDDLNVGKSKTFSKKSKPIASVLAKAGCSSQTFRRSCTVSTPTPTPSPTPTNTPTPTPTNTPTPTPTPTPTCTPTPTPTPDCSGLPGGGKVVDACGVCGGDNSTCKDCKGVVNGPNTIDACGVCDADASNDNLTCIDCEGKPNGGKIKDECGVCGGDNSTCKDCKGIPNGSAVIDACGVCDGQSNTCLDCAGVPNGPNRVDQCGVCDADASNDNLNCIDCFGTPNGTAKIDACGVCNGNNACIDCAGIPNGGTKIDDCGVCGGDNLSCRCPLKKVKIDKSDLIKKIKILYNDKTIKYYKGLLKCDKSKKKVVRKQIKKATKILEQYIEIVRTIPTEVEVCPGQCVDVVLKKTINKLRKLNKALYRYVSDAQHRARKACKKTGPGKADSKKLSNELDKDIKECHDNAKVCA